MNVIGQKQQRWYVVDCRPECRSDGPWVIYGPGKEKFPCVRCGKGMTVRQVSR